MSIAPALAALEMTTAPALAETAAREVADVAWLMERELKKAERTRLAAAKAFLKKFVARDFWGGSGGGGGSACWVFCETSANTAPRAKSSPTAIATTGFRSRCVRK